jgi:hypothetical protein
VHKVVVLSRGDNPPGPLKGVRAHIVDVTTDERVMVTQGLSGTPPYGEGEMPLEADDARSVGDVSYDVLAESVGLLEGAPLPGGARLSRRVRHVPLAVDRDGDVAATMFLRRGVSGVPLLDVHTLELTEGGWRMLGGGGGPGDEATEARPRLADLGSPSVSHGHGGTARTRSSRLGRSKDNWVAWARLRVAAEISVLRVDTRLLPVAGHGCAVVVWTREPPRVAALDASGAVLGSVLVHRLVSRRVRPVE